MVFSSGVIGGDELHAHSLGLLSEVVQDPLAVALLEVILPPVGVFLPVGEHGIDQSGQLVGSGRHRFGLVHARAHSPVVRTQRRLARAQGRCRQPQRLGRAVGAAFGFAAHDLAAGDLGARTQTQPGGEVLVAGELAHVHANPRAMCTIAMSVFAGAAFHLAIFSKPTPRVSSKRFAARAGRLLR